VWDIDLSNVPSFRIQSIEELHGLFVHGEDDSAAENQTAESRNSAGPQREEAFFLDQLRGALEAVLVQRSRFY
jgi:hypothetical protein